MESVSRAERLLPWVCVAAAAVLFASQLMTLFEFTPPGAEPLEDRSVIDHHGPALLIIAAFAAFATLVAVLAGSKPAAIAVAVMGGLALLIFLLIDLPDAGQVGRLNDARQSFIDAEAVPQAGFWLEMLGALALALTGAALATLSGGQLAALPPGRRRERERGEGEELEEGAREDGRQREERRSGEAGAEREGRREGQGEGRREREGQPNPQR